MAMQVIKIYEGENLVCKIKATANLIVFKKDGHTKICKIGDEIVTPIGLGIVQQFSNGFRILLNDGDVYQFPWMDLISIL